MRFCFISVDPLIYSNALSGRMRVIRFFHFLSSYKMLHFLQKYQKSRLLLKTPTEECKMAFWSHLSIIFLYYLFFCRIFSREIFLTDFDNFSSSLTNFWWILSKITEFRLKITEYRLKTPVKEGNFSEYLSFCVIEKWF